MATSDKAEDVYVSAPAEPDLAGAMLPPPFEMLRDPLAFIAAEHNGQRALSSMMENLAGAAKVDLVLAGRVLRYLRRDLARHVHDEEGDLFPLMRKRCLPEDEIGEILGMLNKEHKDEDRLAGGIADGLEGLIAGARSAIDADLRERLFKYARELRRHLAMENSIILPLARARLTAADLRALSRSMTRRYAENQDTTQSGH